MSGNKIKVLDVTHATLAAVIGVEKQRLTVQRMQLPTPEDPMFFMELFVDGEDLTDEQNERLQAYLTTGGLKEGFSVPSKGMNVSTTVGRA